MAAKAAHFQVMLSGKWTDYAADEDKILKRAYLAGFPNAKYKLRGQAYEVTFVDGAAKQKNTTTGKSRDIRPPFKWKAPEKPITKAGPTFCISVPPGSPGTTIQVPHPKIKGAFIAVNVPASAKVGQAMLVPIPEGTTTSAIPQSEIKGSFTPQPAEEPKPGKKSWLEHRRKSCCCRWWRLGGRRLGGWWSSPR